MCRGNYATAMMPRCEFDVALFWRMIQGRMKSDGLSIRAAAQQIGVSPPTLSRMQARIPDAESLLKICGWLRTTVDSFVVTK